MIRNREQRRGLPRPDLGRLIARAACMLFALVGALPLLAGFVAQSPPLRSWAASETARLLDRYLGVTASYEVELQVWPLRLQVENLVVPASDGGAPALRADRVAVTPRLFSLLAGQLDVGDIEIEGSRARLVVRDGKLTNVSYRLPKTSGEGPTLDRAPFTSLALTDTRVDLDLDGTRIRTGSVDLDVFAEDDLAFEIALRAGQTRIDRLRQFVPTFPSWLNEELADHVWPSLSSRDEDVVCRIDARIRVSQRRLLIRRLSMLGGVDSDLAPGTRPQCDSLNEENPWQVALRLSQFQVQLRASAPPLIDGHVVARAPVGITNRFVKTLPLRGWAAFAGNVRYDGRTKLPELDGKLRGGKLSFDVYHLAERLNADVRLIGDRVLVPKFEMLFADGTVELENAEIAPFEPKVPIHAERVDSRGMQFPAMMRDLGVTDNTIVKWNLHRTLVTRLRGTIAPLKIDADISGESRDFEVFDRAYHDPARRHVIGVDRARLRGRIGVRPNAFEIYDTRVDFGSSHLTTKLVSIGFDNRFKLVVAEDSALNLADVSPLLDIPMAGEAKLDVKLAGAGDNPLLTGNLAIQAFEFGGFPLGDIEQAKVSFRPLKLELTEVLAKKGKSRFRVNSGVLDFDTSASIVVDADVQSERFDLRDFFAIWHFDKDPRFEELHGTAKVNARVHYALGGHEDVCKSGFLRVQGSTDFHELELFEERYDSGAADFDFRWRDQQASYLGINLDVPSLSLRKGPGTLLGSLTMREGARVQAHFVGTAIPLSKLDALGAPGRQVAGHVSAVAEVGGRLDALEVEAVASVSPVRIGAGVLPASTLHVRLEPTKRALVSTGTSKCGHPIPSEFDPAAYARDEVDGIFHVDGALFGDQIRLSDFQVTRQRAKVTRGKVHFKAFDLGSALQILPAFAASESPLDGRLSGELDLEHFAMRSPSQARASLTLSELSIARSGIQLEALPTASPLRIEAARLEIPRLSFSIKGEQGPGATFDLSGMVQNLGKDPRVAASLQMRPQSLSAFASEGSKLERASGTVLANFQVEGPLAAPRYDGSLQIKDGELSVRGLPTNISDLQLVVQLNQSELVIKRGTAEFSGGKLTLRGGAPLRGTQLGEARLSLIANNVALPLGKGIRATVDSELLARYRFGEKSSKALPRVTGTVNLRSFEYTRPLTMTADIASLAQRGKRTKFESYDPADDFVDFDITLRSHRPLRIRNNLIETDLILDDGGLSFTGSNQRFGLRGAVRLKPGGHVSLRGNSFEIRQGWVRFNDATRIAPQVDVTAVTEYRRYGNTSATSDSVTTTSSIGGSTSGPRGTRWRILMHAHGDADNLQVDLTSDPALAQDDIFLLLTVGLTRAELDQAQSASVGESVALETLGTLTGADRAVKDAVPVIDEVRFGSTYSTRTGRTEPTLTIGKRLAERLSASVTSGLSDSREVRSNLEWRLNQRVSVEGSYDNVNTISSSSLGNLGADIRWRLEFE